MVKDSEIPPPSEKRPTIPPKAPDKLRNVRLMISRNRRRLMSNKILPVVDPETKEPLPFADEKYYEKLKLLAEEEGVKKKEYEALSEEDRLKQPELELEGYEEDHELWELLKNFFENATGKSMEELRSLTLENSREIDAMATKVENGIVNSMPFLDGNTHEERKNQLRGLSDKANTFYRHYIRYLPEATQSLRWGTTLTNADNNVGQLALKFIASKNPRLREHSKIKLLLMLHSGFTTNHKNKGVGFEESLSFLTNFITRTVAHYDKNDERGCSTTKFLKTTHSPKVRKTDKFFIYDSEDEFTLGDNERSQKIEIRKAVVTNHDGEERIIEFVIDSRKKDDNSTTEKGLREDKTSIKDHHGVKFIFKTKDDARDYERLLIDKLQREYSEVLILEYGKVKNREASADQSYDNYSKQLAEIMEGKENSETTPLEKKRIERLAERINAVKTMKEESIKDQERIMQMLNKKDECITIEGIIEEGKRDENGKIMKDKNENPIIEKKKVRSTNVEEVLEKLVDNIDKGKHKGGSKGSSERFKVRKYYIDYHYPDFRDEKIMPFEWQFQLYDGYVDTLVRHKVSEEEFHVNRVFDGGVMELLASPDVHQEVDLEKANKDRIDEIRYRVEDALTHSRKGRRKLTKERRRKAS